MEKVPLGHILVYQYKILKLSQLEFILHICLEVYLMVSYSFAVTSYEEQPWEPLSVEMLPWGSLLKIELYRVALSSP